MPSLINVTAEEAQRQLDALGLVAVINFEINEEVEPGLVFEQTPGRGEQAEVGSDVVLKVSKAADTVTLSSVIGLTEDEARAILQGLGLRVVPKLEASDTVPEGVVIAMSPEPDQEVNLDTLVTLTISTGPAEVEVPFLQRTQICVESRSIARRWSAPREPRLHDWSSELKPESLGNRLGRVSAGR